MGGRANERSNALMRIFSALRPLPSMSSMGLLNAFVLYFLSLMYLEKNSRSICICDAQSIVLAKPCHLKYQLSEWLCDNESSPD